MRIRVRQRQREETLRICVIFTGGTIGSAVKGGTVGLSDETSSLLIDMYREKYGAGVAFDVLRPVSILSENVQLRDLDKMTECVRSVARDGYDGIIVTHGTDTLTFTANYFSQIFCDIPVPLVLVSALLPLEDPESNGPDNFAAAVTFIRRGIRGVFVSFKNPYEPCRIHLASRLTYSEQLSGRTGSLLGVHFGEVHGREFVHNAHPLNPSEDEVRACAPPPPAGESLCNDVVVIKARALLDFSFYRFADFKPGAVIVELYHSGTICTAGWDTNFEIFLEKCCADGIPVVIGPVDSAANVYDSAAGLAEKCTIAYDISFEMTVLKVMLALGGKRPPAELLRENRAFEKLVRPAR